VIRGEYRVLSSRGWAREKTRGEYRFMKLMNLKKKGGGITLSFTSPEKDFFQYIYEVFTSLGKETKR